jgi:tRNA1(Val) A37 N6-methylase TrmN6
MPTDVVKNRTLTGIRNDTGRFKIPLSHHELAGSSQMNKGAKTASEISNFLEKKILGQLDFESALNKASKKKSGVFLTNSLVTVANVLNIVEIDSAIFDARVLEPSCGQGIFVLKLIADVYDRFPDKKLIAHFISHNLFFVDIQKEMVEKTISNIKSLFLYLFDDDYKGSFNAINWDFTDNSVATSLFDKASQTAFSPLYNRFDYVIGNPPYVTLYGRRDKKENEEQRISYLKRYRQFPEYVKNGKLNLVMLFIEHSLDLLKDGGKLSFIIDVSFLETAYQFTRQLLLEETEINELQVNIKDFDVVSGQVILKATKCKGPKSNNVRIIDHKSRNSYLVSQSHWANKNDEFKFRFNGCAVSKQIIEKIKAKTNKTLHDLFPNKNLRTCTMLLNMEDRFTLPCSDAKDGALFYPYYQGSKALSEKYGRFDYAKIFFYNKPLQDSINDALKIQLEKEGIKNKKRIGLGNPVIYDNPKIFIRQSAKQIIASVDLKRSAANNSLYVFSLQNDSPETVEFLFFLCGWLNSDLVTYYAQKRSIIRFSEGKQPQIKIADLGTVYIPTSKALQSQISELCKQIYASGGQKQETQSAIDDLIYSYYELTSTEIRDISKSIKAF